MGGAGNQTQSVVHAKQCYPLATSPALYPLLNHKFQPDPTQETVLNEKDYETIDLSDVFNIS